MELQQFITTAIKAIGKGIQEGKEGNIEPGSVSATNPVGGVEFDLGIVFDNDKITVEDRREKDMDYVSRIKFAIPIYIGQASENATKKAAYKKLKNSME